MRLSPSVLECVEACPRYESAPSDESSDVATEGTLLHKAMETGDTTGLDDDQLELVERCKEYTRDDEGAEIFRELKVTMCGLRGTVDYFAKRGKKGRMIDYKFGRIPVTPAGKNGQLQSYVLGLFERFDDLEEVEAELVMPRLDDVTIHTYRRSDMASVVDRIAAVMARLHMPNARENPVEKACRYCARKAFCQALSELASTVCTGVSGMQLPEVYKPGEMVLPEDRAKAQVLSYILEDWAKQVRKENVKAALENGVEIPGFEVRHRAGSPRINQPDAAFEMMKERFGLSLHEFLSACTVKVTGLLDVTKEVVNSEGAKKTKADVRSEVFETLKDVINEGQPVVFLQRKKGKTDEEIIQGSGTPSQ